MGLKIRWLLLLSVLAVGISCSTATENDGIDEQKPLAASDAAGDSASLEQELGGSDLSPPPEEIAPPIQTAAAPKVSLVNLEFRALPDGGTVVVTTDQPAQFTTRRNSGDRQFVIEVQNADLPAKLRRPYNTREFPGPIQGFQAYQNQGGSTARIVVQMRSDAEPRINQSGNRIELTAQGKVDAPLAQSQGEPADETSLDSEFSDGNSTGAGPVSSKASASGDPDVLGNKTFNAFLMGQSRYYGKKISLQVKDADLRDVFNLIAEESGLNIVLSESVKGKVTLKLKKIPWDQALVVVMKSNQLGYVRQGSILRIAPLKEIKDENEQAKSVLDAQRSLTPLRVQIFPISYAKADELAAQANSFKSPRGSVISDKRTNALIATDIDENLARIARLVEELDTQTPQVLIEARIVEARDEFQRTVGINWGLQSETIKLGARNGIPINAQGNIRAGTQNTAPNALSLSVGTIPILGDLDATLSLYELESKVKVLSSPKVMTLNGEKAEIEQSIEIPYIVSSLTGTTILNTVSFKTVSLKLNVTPQVAADGGILMEVKVTREFLGAQIGDQRAVNKRSASTKILIENGQTSVLGGIYQNDVTEGEDGVPFLRKIPLIGALFRGSTTERQKSELLIFLTPRVVNAERVFSKNLQNGGKG